ncbi:MAG: exo-alpha-sialidase [Deltaproteobacteria bacterium]|nr:exo-alpha-sialidase [Deltaproteobacteria bacterium]
MKNKHLIFTFCIILMSCSERENLLLITDTLDPDVLRTEEDDEVIKDTGTIAKPLFEKGYILPPNSLHCTNFDTGITQKECNHHGSTIAQLKDGSIAVVWYHGVAEKSKDSRIVWSKYIKSEKRWTDVLVLYDDPERSEGNPAIWVDDNGDIYIFFVTIFGSTWDETKIRYVKSTDNGKTFSEPVFLNEEYCYNTRHRPVKLGNGDLLLPLYNECLALPVFMRIRNNFKEIIKEFELTADEIMDRLGQIQPALIKFDDDRVAAITRDGTHNFRIHRMESSNFGKKWGKMEILGLPNSGTSVDWVRLKSGEVVVVFNNSPTNRFPLSVALSKDEGHSFIALADINNECDKEGGCSYAYPSIIQDREDETIWVSYTHNRETIGFVHFNKEWLMQFKNRAVLRCKPSYDCIDSVCLKRCGDKAECSEGEDCDSHCIRNCISDSACKEGEFCSQKKICLPVYDTERVDQGCY